MSQESLTGGGDEIERLRIKPTCFVCDFTVGLDELPRRKQKDKMFVLDVLSKHRRFSVFEATANLTIAKTLEAIQKNGWITYLESQYPWVKVELTDAGKAALEQHSQQV